MTPTEAERIAAILTKHGETFIRATVEYKSDKIPNDECIDRCTKADAEAAAAIAEVVWEARIEEMSNAIGWAMSAQNQALVLQLAYERRESLRKPDGGEGQ